jgi:hypothetical protein
VENHASVATPGVTVSIVLFIDYSRARLIWLLGSGCKFTKVHPDSGAPDLLVQARWLHLHSTKSYYLARFDPPLNRRISALPWCSACSIARFSFVLLEFPVTSVTKRFSVTGLQLALLQVILLLARLFSADELKGDHPLAERFVVEVITKRVESEFALIWRLV